MFKKFPNFSIAFLSIAVLCVTLSIFFSKGEAGEMKISFLDVGQGDAVLITSPSGNRLLYDSGTPDNKILTAIENELNIFDRRIDFFVASHPDADHIGGFLSMVDKFSPKYYIDGHTLNVSSLFSSLENKINSRKINRYTAKRGTKIDLGKGVVAYVLSPAQDERKENLTSNDASVVLFVVFGNTRVLLMGDMEEKEEKYLVRQYGDKLRASILKVGHHGSKSSTSDILLRVVKPEFSVISVGSNNRYGHPNLATINRLMFASTTIYETSKMGTVRFSCDTNICRNIN